MKKCVLGQLWVTAQVIWGQEACQCSNSASQLYQRILIHSGNPLIYGLPQFGSFSGPISMKNGVLGPFWVPEQGSYGLRSIPIQIFYKPIVPTYPNLQWKPIHIWFTPPWKLFCGDFNDKWCFVPFCATEQGSQGLRSIPIQHFSKPIVPTYPNSQWQPIYIWFTPLWKIFWADFYEKWCFGPFLGPGIGELWPKKHTNLVFLQANCTNIS